MAQALCRKRLQRELVALKKNPVEHVQATPSEKNILEWHYVIEGPKDSVYEGGYYHGVLRFPKEYPYKPPSILMFTKNGRFKTNVRLCLSMSDFHPETWNPMWSVSSILSGFLSFMLDSAPTLGSMEASDAQRRMLASKSLEENVRNKDFCALFPHYVELYKKKKAESQKSAAAGSRTPRSVGKAGAAKSNVAAKASGAAAPAADETAGGAGAPLASAQSTASGILSSPVTAVVLLVLAASLYWVWGRGANNLSFNPFHSE